jgi:hypothetical protein
MFVYLANLRISNIEAQCTHCGNVELIFLQYGAILLKATHKAITVVLTDEPDDALIERAEKAWRRGEEPELPEIPRTWSREFWDTLREFEGES